MRLPWQARGEDSELPLQEATVRFLLGELKFRMPGREPTKKEKNGSMTECMRSVRIPNCCLQLPRWVCECGHSLVVSVINDHMPPMYH